MALPSNIHVGSPDSSTRPVVGHNYPTEVEVMVGTEKKKFPVSYFEKLVLKVGRFVHPKTKEVFTLTREFLDQLAQRANDMIAADIEIPTPLDHLDNCVAHKRNPYFVKAADNIGYVVKATREGDCLKFIQAAIGEDAALTAVRNRSSVYIKPFQDCNGKDWGTCIVHSAYTPIPVMHGLGAPTSLTREDGPVMLELARDQETVMTLSEAQKKRLRALAILNGKTKEDAEKLDDAALQEEGIKYVEKLPDDFEISKYETFKKDSADLAAAKTELTAVQSRETELKQKLAKEDPDAPTVREIKFAKETAEARIDNAVASKKFSPSVGELIKEKIKAEPMNLLLSRTEDDDKPEPYETLIEVATKATASPIPGSTTTEDKKTKKLSRDTVKDDEEDEEMKPVDIAKKAGEKLRSGRKYAVPGVK